MIFEKTKSGNGPQISGRVGKSKKVSEGMQESPFNKGAGAERLGVLRVIL